MAIQKISNAVLGTGSVNATSIATGGVTLGDIPDAEITLAKLHTDVQTPINAVAGKQATIVSGTHIKTINSVSIVGSGNVVLGAVQDVFYENAQTVSTSYSISSNKSAMSAGPVTLASGVTITIPTGSRWVIV
jgi:hypothetical protein|tara:strand:- start:280 stop:678 length:399 start_codon:yes stop_codon:yes gene_type:complete